jgi:Fur family peroxide stress response transcriptional regulator
MKKKLPVQFIDEQLTERLAKTGLRFTAQRRHVYGVLLQRSDHPNAEDVFIRAKETLPDISLATVYNSLDTLVKCGLVRQVKGERGGARYCSNMSRHHHFVCDECGGTYDIELESDPTELKARIPEGFRVTRCDLSYRGLCAECAGPAASAPA